QPAYQTLLLKREEIHLMTNETLAPYDSSSPFAERTTWPLAVGPKWLLWNLKLQNCCSLAHCLHLRNLLWTPYLILISRDLLLLLRKLLTPAPVPPAFP